ncbi:MAG: hypothetical protein ALAOOOJD_03606 [bacterium]|nr:hypothetical protein [bacterium]
MFGYKKLSPSPVQRLIGLISLPCRNNLFVTRIYELREFNTRSFAAETALGEEPDDRVVSHADQLGDLIRIHLDRIYDTQFAHAAAQ